MQERVLKRESSRSNPTFLSQFLKNPKAIGAVLPSSPMLGRVMSEFVPQVPGGIVVELGPGTGPITKALLKAGLHEKNLFCIEQSERMVKHLRAKFPRLTVVHGDARELAYLLNGQGGRVHTIVSSLPLKNIDEAVVDAIVDQMESCLEPGGTVIQFTYDLRKRRSPLLKRFKPVRSKIVFVNLPPARVDVFKKI